MDILWEKLPQNAVAVRAPETVFMENFPIRFNFFQWVYLRVTKCTQCSWWLLLKKKERNKY